MLFPGPSERFVDLILMLFLLRGAGDHILPHMGLCAGNATSGIYMLVIVFALSWWDESQAATLPTLSNVSSTRQISQTSVAEVPRPEIHRSCAVCDRMELSRRLAVLEKKLLRGQSTNPAGPSNQSEQDIASLESQLSSQVGP